MCLRFLFAGGAQARPQFLGWLLALGTLGFAGCADSTSEERTVAELNESCSLDSDCDADLICAFGRCHVECQATRDCPRESRCVHGPDDGVFVCQFDEERDCASNRDCGGTQVCAADGECRDECEVARDCAKEQICVEGPLVCADEEELDADGRLVDGSDDDAADADGGTDDDAADDDATADDAAADDDATADDDTADDDVTADDDLPEVDSGTSTSGTAVTFEPEGGEYEAEGVLFSVPPNAVPEPTEVVVAVVDEPPVPLPEQWIALSDIFAITPHEQTFTGEITLMVPYSPGAAASAVLLVLDDDSDTAWDVVDVASFDDQAGVASAARDSLSYYVVVEPVEPAFDCSSCAPDQVCQFERCYDPCSDLDPCADGSACCELNGQGYCVDTDTDTNHCGACNAACNSDNASDYGCASGICEINACDEPYEDCNGNPDDGCEVNLQTDAGHCGTCGNVCGEGADCLDGVCDEGLTALYAGYHNTCVVRTNGRVLCWGNVGGIEPRLIPDVESPADMDVDQRICALLPTGRVTCWDYNLTLTPVNLTGAVGVSIGITSSIGENFGCAVRDNGLVSCWGIGSYGRLGDGQSTNSDDPVAVSGLSDAVQVALGSEHACALRATGEAVCWGHNNYAQLGDGTTIDRNAPVPVQGVDDLVFLASGSANTCGVRAGGGVVCWGSNSSLLISGTASKQTNFSTAQVVDGLSGVERLDLNLGTACALADGQLLCWGTNNVGQLGDGTTTERHEALAVPGLSDIVSFAVGQYHVCALPSAGPPLCWGDNNYGSLGDGSKMNSSVPVVVNNLP